MIADFCDAPRSDFAVIFVGAGVTGAIHKFAHLLGIRPRVTSGWKSYNPPVILISTMDHHSNVVFWREMDCILEVCQYTTHSMI